MYLQHCVVVTWLVPHEPAAISAHSVYTIQPCTMLHHFIQSHIHGVHVCSAVTGHLHFWQNGQDLLHAIGRSPRGWKGDQKLLLLLLPGLEPATFQSWVWCSNHWVIPALRVSLGNYCWVPLRALWCCCEVFQAHNELGCFGNLYY